MIDLFPPFLAYVLGAVLLPLLPKGARAFICLLVPLIGAWLIWSLPMGEFGQVSLSGLDITLLRVDKLSVIFGLIFSLAGFLTMLYAWHVRDLVQQISALLYAGSAIGAVFAGDFVSLFIFWEGTAIASVFLIWARRTEGAYYTGMRYLIIQIMSGVILLAGVVMLYRETGSIAFEAMTLGSLATWAIFIAFGIKCAFPFLHNWLQDAYPAATVTGAVILSAFTTKLAIYALARGFPGTELLIYIGAVMCLFPIFYGIIENDLRRVLAYSLNNQLGFMVVGIGVGTELALSGTAAQAFAHVLYKALLFMSIGAVLYRTGTAKASELGGLYKTMPLTMLLCVIGALSTSTPLFSGFVTKSLIFSSTAGEGYFVVWAIMVLASAGVFLYTAIKIPYFAFFAKDSGLRPKEAPAHMLLAMGITAIICIAVGVYPEPLYAMLPFDVSYQPYTKTHVITQMQLLFFTALAFALLMKFGAFPKQVSSVNLDADVIYRKFLPNLISRVTNIVTTMGMFGTWVAKRRLQRIVASLYSSHGPEGRMARVWPTGSMVLWIAIILGATMTLNFI